MKAEVVCDGIRFGEGPVWCDDGTWWSPALPRLALSRRARSEPCDRVRRHRRRRNGAALAADGSILVTQNGGFDFAATGLFADPPPFRPATPGSAARHAGRNRHLPRRRRLPGSRTTSPSRSTAPSTSPTRRTTHRRRRARAGSMRLDRDGTVAAFADRVLVLQRHRLRTRRQPRRRRAGRAASASIPTARASG